MLKLYNCIVFKYSPKLARENAWGTAECDIFLTQDHLQQ